ncbi:MAG: DUF5711 family protein [Clostridiales bacterium]|nr:DUF5711 family protein [Clostridiales bacterium]
MTYSRDSREAKKRRLRDNIIISKESGKDSKGLSLIVFIVLLICAAGIAFGAYWMLNRNLSESYSIMWVKSQDSEEGPVETFKGYKSFAGGIIRYTKDGAEYIDRGGNIVWERSYQLNSPIVDVSEKFAVIGDQGSTKLYIFDSKGMTGSSETLLPVSILRIADSGVVYAVLNDNAAEYITAFKPDGSAIDLSVKSIFKGDGYPFAIDSSPDGTELITSYISIESGVPVNDVVFRNFGAIGQNEDARRIVGGFRDEFAGHMVGSVNFSTNEFSQAFYDGGVVFFSTEVLNSPEIIVNHSFEERIESVDASGETVALLLEADKGAGNQKLVIFSVRGEKKAEIELDFDCQEMCMTESFTVLRSENRLYVYGKNGVLRAEFEYTDGDIVEIAGGGEKDELFVITAADIVRIKY